MKDSRSVSGAQTGHRRLLPLVAVSVLLIVGGLFLFTRGDSQPTVQTQVVAVTEKADQVAVQDDRIELVKALGLTQQQTVDQLQVVQDQLAAQQADIKKLMEKVTMLSEKLDGLQPPPPLAPTAALDVASPKTTHRR